MQAVSEQFDQAIRRAIDAYKREDYGHAQKAAFVAQSAAKQKALTDGTA